MEVQITEYLRAYWLTLQQLKHKQDLGGCFERVLNQTMKDSSDLLKVYACVKQLEQNIVIV
jgi:hypothetical protein